MATNEKSRPPLGARLLNNALIRLAMMGACLMIWLVGFRGLAMPALRGMGEPGTIIGDGARIIGALIYVVGAIIVYAILVRKFERREPAELAGQPGAKLGFQGFGIGLALCCTVIGAMWLVGAAQPAGFGDSSRLVAQFTAAMMASVGEELLFRGILFRILEQAMGTVRALLASALFFGLAHIVNPDATLASSLVIAIESGIMLGLAFVATRSLWFPIGIHLAWNFAQGGIFGATGSANPPSLVQIAFVGPNWVTGGPTGTDMSAITVAFCVALAVTFAIVARNRSHWQPARLRFRLS